MLKEIKMLLLFLFLLIELAGCQSSKNIYYYAEVPEDTSCIYFSNFLSYKSKIKLSSFTHYWCYNPYTVIYNPVDKNHIFFYIDARDYDTCTYYKTKDRIVIKKMKKESDIFGIKNVDSIVFQRHNKIFIDSVKNVMKKKDEEWYPIYLKKLMGK